jgi:hypothetical protein
MRQPISQKEALCHNVRSARADGGHGGLPSNRKMRRIFAALERKQQKKARKAEKRGGG